MQGLWVCTVTRDHPFAFEPNTGPVTPLQEYHVGEVFKAYEGSAEDMPQAGKVGGLFYRWVFFAGVTLPEIQAVDAWPRLINDEKPAIRSATDFKADCVPCLKRSVLDKILRRRPWL